MGLRRKLALAVPAVAALLAAAPAQACRGEGAEPHLLTAKQAREAVICLVNERRRNQGLHALRPDGRLTRAAQRHSRSMDSANYFSHSSPGGGTPQGRIQRTGYMAGASAWAIAENIRWGAGRGSAKAAVGAWMRSSSHRAALLSPSYRELGVGVAIGSPTGHGEGNSAIYTTTFGFRR